MILRFSIVVICFIVGELAQRPDDEVIQDSFDDCLKWTNHGQEPTDHVLTVDLLLYYLGNHSPRDADVIDCYFVDNPSAKGKKENIDKALYGALLQHFWKKQYATISFEVFAELRKNAGLARSLKDMQG
ncbi:uncharacterized protein LOC126836791 [Adelges cooleyi]|uniref:uncharacterized protein LOC126836791 n=1 Tax=Adelges cooleyi TaxID=133065 RepID=UPI00217FD0A9|nr:uncharacterized protein LOC126836791 [Adelges cooleyi]